MRIDKEMEKARKKIEKLILNTYKPEEGKPKKNQFDISYGNLQVLKDIPEMMQQKEWRDKLRMLSIEFQFKNKK